MPRLANAAPRYCRHRPSGQAVVTLDGKAFYLGPWGTNTSKREYDRLVGEWQGNGRRLPARHTDQRCAVADLILDYVKHCHGYYRKPDGTPTSQLHLVVCALRHVRRLYGDTPADEFDVTALKCVRESMMKQTTPRPLSRGTINDYLQLVRQMFQWGAANGRVPASVYVELKMLDGLRAGLKVLHHPCHRMTGHANALEADRRRGG